MDQDDHAWGDYFADALAERGFGSIKALAEHVGRSASVVSRWQHTPPPKALRPQIEQFFEWEPGHIDATIESLAKARKSVPLHVAQDRLGHAELATTMSHYIRAAAGADAAAAGHDRWSGVRTMRLFV